MSPPTVDLSLPSNEQLLGAAAPNPEVEAARITATGDPDQLSDVGTRLQRTGTELDQVYRQSTQTQRVLAGSFTNDGTPVYDAQAHRELMPAGFADAGSRLHDAGRRVGVVAVELSSAIDDVTAAQSRLFGALNGRRLSFAAEVDGARGPDGLIPAAQVAALQARRNAVAAEMQESVNSCGRDVVARVGGYQGVLQGCRQLLGELGAPGPLTGGGRFGFPGARLEGGGISGFTVPGPTGPSIIVDPIPDPPLPTPGFTPAPPGTGPLITLPAPDLGTAVQDGPGSGQGGAPAPVRIDAAETPPISPEGRAGLDDYIGPGHKEINQALRGEIPLTPELQRRIDSVSGGLSELPPAPGVVFRGTELTEADLARYQPGQTVEEPAFTSTSRDPSRTFRGNVEFTIDSVDGKYVAPFAPPQFAPQEEVLFDRGTRFEVLSRTMNPQTGKVDIELREIPG